MTLISMFSIIKYGAKIFLAVMGFISFDDINVKQVNFQPGHSSTDTYSVQFFIPNNNETANNIFYANEMYFPLNEEPINYMICSETKVPIELNERSFQVIDERNQDIFSKISVSMNETLFDFDVIVIDPTEKLSAVKYIKVLSENANYSSRSRITNSGIIISELIN